MSSTEVAKKRQQTHRSEFPEVGQTPIVGTRASIMYFCTACNLYVRETSVSDHDQSTAHMLATTRAPTLRKVWLPESNRGYQLLMGMGWKEDSGLGPRGDGRIEPIATVLKNDKAGLGTAHPPARVTHFSPQEIAERAKRMRERRARKRKEIPGSDDPHNMTAAQRKLHKARDQQRDQAIAMEIYTPDDLEGYEAYLR